MKLALAHDWLNTTLGGSERVFIELTRLYPHAPIYTLLFDRDHYRNLIDPQRVQTSLLQKLPQRLRRSRKYLLPLIPSAVNHLTIPPEYEVVLSSSNGFIKGLRTSNKTAHICYCHTPGRFVWEDRRDYLKAKANLIQIGPAATIAAYFKHWDVKSSRRVDQWLANSQYTAQRIKNYYEREAQIIYPPVEVAQLKPYWLARKQDYFITLSTLSAYKRVDLVIEAFNASGRPLVVIGEGPEKARLRAIAKANIKFTGWVKEADKARYLAGAKALIFPAIEDFGIAPVEAMAVGTPVIALKGGGLSETVAANTTGLFFKPATPTALNHAISKFEGLEWNARAIQQHTQQFAKERFIGQIKEAVNKVVTK